MMKPVNFGIDLGTTNSLIAKFDGTKVHVFKNPVGQKETLASVVAYRPDRILVGDKAREYLTKDPVNVFGNFKRKMGTDEKYYVVNIDDNVTPVQLSALVLKELKNFVHTGEVPEACVITIPASFDTMQSNATLKAGEEAGFKTIFLLQEPIAASLAFFNEAAGDIFHLLWRCLSFVPGLARKVRLRSNALAKRSFYRRGCAPFGRHLFPVMARRCVFEILVLDSALCTGIRGCNSDLSGTSNIFWSNQGRYRRWTAPVGVGGARYDCQPVRQNDS